jgi:hypothetical protein
MQTLHIALEQFPIWKRLLGAIFAVISRCEDGRDMTCRVSTSREAKIARNLFSKLFFMFSFDQINRLVIGN